ncbi:MAG: WD40 repeat domain-containing protein, partial [Roseimicrobium sp.]
MSKNFAHETMVRGARFLRDGLALFTWGEDDSVRVWATDGTGSATVLPNDGRLLAVEPGPDGRTLATTTPGGVTLWDATVGTIKRTLAGRTALRCIAHSPDGSWIAAGGDDATVNLWHASTGEAAGPLLQHGGAVSHVGFSPDGSRLLTASPDGAVRLWHVPVANPRGLRLTAPAAVNHVNFAAKGLSVIASVEPDTAQIWDVSTGRRVGPAIEGGGSSPITSDGSRMLRIVDSAAQVFDVASGKALGGPLQAGEAPIRLAAFSPDGTRAFTATEDDILRIWDLTSGSQVGVGMQHRSHITSASYSPDGTLLVTSSGDGSVRVWDANAATLKLPPLQHGSLVFCARFSPDGRFIVTASMDNTARVWDTQTGKALGREITQKNLVIFAEFNHACTHVVTTNLERETFVWDVESVLRGDMQRVPAGLPVDVACVTCIKHEALMSRADFSPDGRWIVTEPDANAPLAKPDSMADGKKYPA